MSIKGRTRQGEWRWAGRARRFRPPRNIHCVVEAGIRAREGELQSPWRAAFPWGYPTVALLARPLSPTVAGAAQELEPQRRFRTCFPFNRRGMTRRRHLNGWQYSPKVPHGVGCRPCPHGHVTCGHRQPSRNSGRPGVSGSPTSEIAFNAHRYRLTLRNLCHYSSTMDTEPVSYTHLTLPTTILV